jgi:hypothetical protein
MNATILDTRHFQSDQGSALRAFARAASCFGGFAPVTLERLSATGGWDKSGMLEEAMTIANQEALVRASSGSRPAQIRSNIVLTHKDGSEILLVDDLAVAHHRMTTFKFGTGRTFALLVERSVIGVEDSTFEVSVGFAADRVRKGIEEMQEILDSMRTRVNARDQVTVETAVEKGLTLRDLIALAPPHSDTCAYRDFMSMIQCVVSKGGLLVS